LVESLTASTTVVSAWVALIRANIHYLALAGAAYYFVTAVVPYRPKDELRRRYRTTNEPKFPHAWEHVVILLIPAMPLSLVFLVAYFLPDVLSVVPGGALGVAVPLFVIAAVAQRHASLQSYEYWTDGGTADTIRATGQLHETPKMEFVWAALAGVIVLSGVVPNALGLSLVEALFYAHLYVAVRALRAFRYLLYQDHDGFIGIEPNLRLWGTVSRVPFAYAIIVVVGGGFATVQTLGFPVFCSFAPIVAILGYIPFRYYRLGGKMRDVRARIRFARERPKDIEGRARRELRASHGDEIADLQLPANKMWPLIRKAVRKTEQAAEAASALQDDRAVGIDPRVRSALTTEEGSTYEKRRDNLASVRRTLDYAETMATESDSEDADEALELVEEAWEAYHKAWNLNDKNGRLKREFFNRFL
jgi:hypothetical protein